MTQTETATQTWTIERSDDDGQTWYIEMCEDGPVWKTVAVRKDATALVRWLNQSMRARFRKVATA